MVRLETPPSPPFIGSTIVALLLVCNLFELVNNEIGNFQILLFCATANTYRTDNSAVNNQKYATRNKSNAVVAGVHSNQIATIGNKWNKVFCRSLGYCSGICLIRNERMKSDKYFHNLPKDKPTLRLYIRFRLLQQMQHLHIHDPNS